MSELHFGAWGSQGPRGPGTQRNQTLQKQAILIFKLLFKNCILGPEQPGAQGGQEFQKNQSLQKAIILRCKLLCKNCILEPGAARGPQGDRICDLGSRLGSALQK